MKKITVLIIAILATSTLLISGVFGHNESVEKGSGVTEVKSFNLAEFNGIEASSAFSLEITKGDKFFVEITADDNIIEKINVEKKGKTLVIELKSGFNFRHIDKLEAKIVMPELVELDLSGASSCTLMGDFSTENTMTIDLSGASEVKGNLSCEKMELDISGASYVNFEGSTKLLEIDGSGASSLELADFVVEDNINIDLSGASNTKINFNGYLDAELSGCSIIKYTGKGKIRNIDASGMSEIKKM